MEEVGQRPTYRDSRRLSRKAAENVRHVSYLNEIYARETRGIVVDDISVLKVNEVSNWLPAWQFMEMCGFTG